MLGWGKSKKAESAPAKADHPSGVTAVGRSQSAAGAAASTPAKPKVTKTLGEILVAEGVITEGQRKEALALQATSGDQSLVQILIEKGYLHGNLLSSFLAKRFGLPHVSLIDCLVNNELFQYVPKELCRRYSVLPLDRLGTIVTLAMVNPLDQEALEAVRKNCPEMRIKSILCDWNGFKSVAERVLQAEKKPVDLTASSLGLSIPRTASRPTDAAAPVRPVAEPAPTEKPEAPAPPKDADPLRSDTKEWNQLVGYAERTLASESAKPEAPAHQPPATGGNLDALMQSSKYETYAVLARRLALFKGLEPMDVATVFDSGMMIEATPNQLLFEKGSSEKDLYVILSGEVAICDGEHELATLSSGEMFGEMALVSNEPRSASAVARTAASLFVLNEEKFRVLLSSKISIRMLLNIVVTLSERLRDANRHAAPPAV